MSDTVDEPVQTLGISGIFSPPVYELFRLHAINDNHVFTINADGTVTLGPNFTGQAAVDEFFKWLSTGTNLVQIAVEQAKKEERASIVKKIEEQGKQWGLMRSMKMTNFSDAAEDLADLIRN